MAVDASRPLVNDYRSIRECGAMRMSTMVFKPVSHWSLLTSVVQSVDFHNIKRLNACLL